MMNNGIILVVSDILNGICELRSKDVFLIILEECKLGCLKEFRCYVIEYLLFCKEYMYKYEIFWCYFGRGMVFIDYKGMVFSC